MTATTFPPTDSISERQQRKRLAAKFRQQRCRQRKREAKLAKAAASASFDMESNATGKSKAKEMILTAQPIDAKDGKNIGLIHKVVERQESDALDQDGYLKDLKECVSNWADEIASLAPLSLQRAKEAIDGGYDRDLEAGLALETKAYSQLLNTKDRLEGLKAFAEKRAPEYKGE